MFLVFIGSCYDGKCKNRSRRGVFLYDIEKVRQKLEKIFPSAVSNIERIRFAEGVSGR